MKGILAMFYGLLMLNKQFSNICQTRSIANTK